MQGVGGGVGVGLGRRHRLVGGVASCNKTSILVTLYI